MSGKRRPWWEPTARRRSGPTSICQEGVFALETGVFALGMGVFIQVWRVAKPTHAIRQEGVFAFEIGKITH